MAEAARDPSSSSSPSSSQPSAEGSGPGEMCCVCLETPSAIDTRVLPCSHTLCRNCVALIVNKTSRDPSSVPPGSPSHLPLCACPLCRESFTPADAKPLLDVLDVLDIFCFDTSSSMWWSDSPVLPLFGSSRLSIAQQMAQSIMNRRRQEAALQGSTYQAVISRFDEKWSPVLGPFGISSDAHERMFVQQMQKLSPSGQKTAFYDAYLGLIQYMERAPRFRKLRLSVVLFTDGQENSSCSDSSKVPERIKQMAKKLHCLSFYVNIGGDSPRSRRVADSIDAKFCDAHSSDWEKVAMSLADQLAQILPPSKVKLPDTPSTLIASPSKASSTTAAAAAPHPHQQLTTTVVAPPSPEERLLSHLPSVPTQAPVDDPQPKSVAQ